MFHKPFRVKTQTAIKGSDRKKLRADLGQHFNIEASRLTEIVPNKDDVTVMKIYTHSGDNIVVYNIRGNPAFFEANRLLYPTVYTLWKYPDLLPMFTTWPPVMKKLLAGADLMLPGVIVKGQVTPTTFGSLGKGVPCAVKLLGNKAPVAVGHTALSGEDMYGSAMRGKGVLMQHTFPDQLWAFGDKSEPPMIEDHEMIEAVRADQQAEEEYEGEDTEAPTHLPDGDNLITRSPDVLNGSPASLHDDEVADTLDQLTLADITGQGSAQGQLVSDGEEEDGEEEEEEEDPKVVQERMDDLLTWCCLCAIKSRVKKSDLPLLTSTFFRNYVQPCCPPGKVVDVRKSSYKKLSKFLKTMQNRGFLKVKEMSKGVESITEVSRDHLELRGFVVPEVVEPEVEPSGTTGRSTPEYSTPVIREMFVINAAVASFFKLCGHSKGRSLSAVDIRKCLTEYVKENDLKTEPKGYVVLDPILSDVALVKGEYLEMLRWEDLVARVLGKMTSACQMTFPGHAPVIKKGKLEPITLSMIKRSGNKKVTLIHWLELYGIDPHEFAHRVQIAMACSTSVSERPGKNQGQEVMVQGNQIAFISNLLLDKYRIPRKYVTGLDKAPKSGKKR